MKQNLELKEAIKSTFLSHSENLSHNDRLFLKRIFKEGIKKYMERLKAISFCGYNTVLDAGCGFGQWSLALSQLNKNVISCDVAPNRINFLADLIKNSSSKNLSLSVNPINKLPYQNETFDCIFCYQVIHYTPWKNSISEFARVLKPGGKLYICTNDIGWYIHLWKIPYNEAEDYNPKEISANSFIQTLDYEETGKVNENVSLIVDADLLLKELEKHGFMRSRIGREGTLADNVLEIKPTPFYNQSFEDLPSVYEILAEKQI